MTNTERIQANNAELRECIELAESLPEAGGVANPVIEYLEITENGTYTAPDGVDGYSPVNVNVPIPDGYVVPNGSVNIDTNGTHNVSGKAEVVVEVPIPEGFIQPSGTKEITENGTYDVTEYAEVNVDCPAGGDTSIEDALLTSELSGEYRNDRITKIGSYCFAGKTKLQSVYLPEVVTMTGTFQFQGCSNLAEVYMPKVDFLANSCFYQCSALKTLDLPSVNKLTYYSLRAKNLEKVILRYNGVARIDSTMQGDGTDNIMTGICLIYVPDEFVEQYKVATNWTKFANQIKPISELEV